MLSRIIITWILYRLERTPNFSNNSKKLKCPWSCSNGPFNTFCLCQRVFRSMNVHRRDPAILRQSPPTDNNPHWHLLNLNTKPNPSD